VEPDALVRDARRVAKLTQAELAQRLGISQPALAKLERPGANPTVRTLDRVLRATGHRLQLIAPVWSAGADASLIRKQLALAPAERLRALEHHTEEMRLLTVAGMGRRASFPELRLRSLLVRLARARVDFVVVGGVAVAVQGYGRATTNLDIVYADDRPNLSRLGDVLVALHARTRGDATTAFVPDGQTLTRGELLSLNTDDGWLGLLAAPPAPAAFATLSDRADRVDLDGFVVPIASLTELLVMKRAAGRRRDMVDIEALEVVQRLLA
jgi:transcriptional regulator with XRE-family HTH domain